MSAFEPKRLIDGDARSRLVVALRDARADVGTEPELARVREGLRALQASGGAGALASSGTGGAATGAAAGGATAKIVLLLGVMIGAAALWSARPAPGDAVQATPRPERPVASVSAPAAAFTPTPTPTPTLTPGEDAWEAAAPRAQAKRPRSASLAVVPPETPAAESEIVLLRRAQALVDTRPGSALEALEVHARAYPSGVFAQERESLAIDALRKLGRRQDAHARGAAFIARYPNSPHARRIRAFLDLAGDSPDDHKNGEAPLPTR